MTGITHKQARRYINAMADNLIKEQEREDLNAHLDTCEECRAYATQMKNLESRLQHSFHQRWNPFHGPSEKLTQNVQSQARKIVMHNRINLGLRGLAGLAALVVLGIAFSLVIGPLISHSTKNPSEGPTAAAFPTPIVLTPSGRLVAFVSGQNGNLDIYVMRSDGSNIANITNNPAQDSNPVWSPDGTKIAFESDRNGNRDIFVMNPDGSGLTQLTNDPADDILGASPTPKIFSSEAPDVWSPDSRHILFSNDATGQWMLNVMNVDGSDVKKLTQADEPPADFALWSPSGKQVAYTWLTGNGWTHIVAVNNDGTNHRVPVDSTRSKTAWHSGRMIGWAQDEQFIYSEYENGDGHWFIVKTATEGAFTAQEIASGYALSEGSYMNGWLGNDSALSYTTLASDLVYYRQADMGKVLHWNPVAICDISRYSNNEFPDQNWAASNEGSQLILAVICQNKGYTELYYLDSMTAAFNEIAQITTALREVNISWSADDQMVMIQGKDPSTKTEIYLLNTGDLQTKPPVKPRLIWNGEGSEAIMQPLRSNP